MRRSASETLRNLEMRVARLERKGSNRTASWQMGVRISNLKRETYNEKKKMTLKQLLKMVKKQQWGGRICTMTFYGASYGIPHVKFECFKEDLLNYNHTLEWMCEVSTTDLVWGMQDSDDFIRLKMRLAKKLNKETYEINRDDPAMAELVEYFLMYVVPLSGGWKSEFFLKSDKTNLL